MLVTIPRVVGEIHFQKTTSSCIVCDLTFCLSSMLKIWSCRSAVDAAWVSTRLEGGRAVARGYAGKSRERVQSPSQRSQTRALVGTAYVLSPRRAEHSPRRAMTFSSTCMMADSAEMGLRVTLFESWRSTMTTVLVPLTSSRTQMKRSDSRVRVAKPIDAG